MHYFALAALSLGALAFGGLTLYLIVASIEAATLFAALPIGCTAALTGACAYELRKRLRPPPKG